MLLRAPTFSVSPRGRFEVASPMMYRWIAKGAVLSVHAGFLTDFATIPGPLRALVKVNDRHRLPAVLHDYLYANGGAVMAGEKSVHYSRKEADLEFLNFMRQVGVSWIRRTAMYRAVRLFGAFFYRDINGRKSWKG